MAEIVVSASEGTVARYVLGRGAVIGRHPECDIVLGDPMASRRHCLVEQGPDGVYYVQDNQSANGTVLNNQLLRTRQALQEGDVIQIGATRLTLKLGTQPSAHNDLMKTGSLVCLKEDPKAEFNPDFTISATGKAVSEAEAATTDVQQLKRVTERLKMLLDVGQSLGSTLDCRKVLQSCLEKLFELFPQAERGFILLYGPDGQIPSTIAEVDSASDALEGRKGALSVSRCRNQVPGQQNRVELTRTVVNRVRERRESVILSDAGGEAGFAPAVSMIKLEIRSVMCSPLIAGADDLGILYLDTKDSRRRFGRDDLNLINAVAGQVAVVIKNAELARAAAEEAASRQNLQRFLAPQLVERIMKKEMAFLELGGQMKHGTVFFSDIVGFTRLAAQMRPTDVVTLLNRYFKVMQDILFQRGGAVDKCSGDEIMASFGVLVDTPLAAAQAALAALEMQNAMFVFNQNLAADETIVKPPTPLGHGIGLNTGDFIAGNIGSERKIEFTVIGNEVNLAKRIESVAGRGHVFIGRATYDEIKHNALVFQIPPCAVKNVDQPLEVFSLRGLRVAGRSGITIPPDQLGQTARVDHGTSEMVFSLPCTLTLEGEAELPGLVTGLAISLMRREGRLQLLTGRLLPPGTRAYLRWNLQEKPSLQGFWLTVEQSCGGGLVVPGATPAQPSPPAPKTSVEHAALVEIHGVRGTLLAFSNELPDDIFDFGSGACIPSDLTAAESIRRE